MGPGDDDGSSAKQTSGSRHNHATSPAARAAGHLTSGFIITQPSEEGRVVHELMDKWYSWDFITDDAQILPILFIIVHIKMNICFSTNWELKPYVHKIILDNHDKIQVFGEQ